MYNNQYMKLNPVIISVIVFFSIFVADTIHAASYGVAPLVIDKELEGRDMFTETITLTNTEDSPVRIFATVNEVQTEDGGTITQFIEPSMIADRSSAITSWIEITRSRIELGPKEKKDITLSVRVNPQAPAGEYHAFIGFPSGSNRIEAERAVYNGSVPGTVLRVGVDRKQSQFLRLERFTADRFVRHSGTEKITFTLKNPGDDAVVPQGEIIFYNNKGDELDAVPVLTTGESIAGGEEKTFVHEVPASLKLGKYKAYLRVEYGTDQKTSLNDTVFFYVIPLKQLIIIFATIVLITTVLSVIVFLRSRTEEEIDDGVRDVNVYLRSSVSAPRDHDIDLTSKK